MKRRTLLLDLDGTLVDSVPDLSDSLNRLMGRLGLAPFTEPEVTAMVGDGAAALVRKAMAARQAEAATADIEAFVADYTVHAAVRTRAYQGAHAVLERLVAEGWRLGICTNKPEAATRALLAALKLTDRLSAIGGGDTFAVRKPHPDHVLSLLRMMGAPPEDAVMVGDHHNDVLAARGAGVPCIFAAWGYGTLNMAEGTLAVAHHLADLPDVLDGLD